MNYQNKELPFYLVPPEVFVCFKLGLCNTRLEKQKFFTLKVFIRFRRKVWEGKTRGGKSRNSWLKVLTNLFVLPCFYLASHNQSSSHLFSVNTKDQDLEFGALGNIHRGLHYIKEPILCYLLYDHNYASIIFN